MRLDLTYRAHQFILVSHFNFLLIPSPFYCMLNAHYRIVSYRIMSITCFRTNGRNTAMCRITVFPMSVYYRQAFLDIAPLYDR